MLNGARLRAGFGAALLVGVLAACSSSPATSASSTVPAGPIVHLTGSGNAVSAAVTLPAAWTVTWHFTCPGATTAQPFVLTAAPPGGTGRTIAIAAQHGLGGGGQQKHTDSGPHAFTVTTGCQWTVDVTHTAPVASSSTTTSSATTR